MTNATQGRRPDGPGAYHYEDGVMAFDCLVTRHHDMRRLVALYVGPWNGKRVDRWEPVDNLPGDFLPLTKPVAAPEPVRETLAAVSHAIWAHWMRYQFSQCMQNADGSLTIPADNVARWERQMQTDYADLTEREKESDRHQAEKILAVLPTPVAAPEPDPDREPSWQDYAALSLHDLAWLREMAEEYEWTHRADPGVDIERVRMVIGRMTIALHKRKEVQSE